MTSNKRFCGRLMGVQNGAMEVKNFTANCDPTNTINCCLITELCLIWSTTTELYLQLKKNNVRICFSTAQSPILAVLNLLLKYVSPKIIFIKCGLNFANFAFLPTADGCRTGNFENLAVRRIASKKPLDLIAGYSSQCA